MQHEDFRPIQNLDVESDRQIPFDLYVNLPLNEKYILYRRAGSPLESRNVARFASRTETHFYIQKEDYEAFVNYVSNRIQQLIQAPESETSRQAMAKLAKSILSSTLQQEDPAVANSLLSNLNDITSVIIESVLEKSATGSKKLFQNLSQLAAKGTNYQKHPVNVASLAVLITFGIGYSREKILTDIAMAALLHDLGLSKLAPEVIQHAHDLNKLGLSQRAGIYRHPETTLEILEEKNIRLSDLAKTIILQHHEEFNGTGYPSGLRGYSINELSQILRIADEIDFLLTQFESGPGDLKAQTADLLKRLGEQKVIEALLLSRVQEVLI